MAPEANPNRAAGGFARAEKLSPKTRKEIASKAASARWNKDLPKASYEGTLKFGSIEFKCAVIEKPNGPADRLVSQSEFMSGLGMYYSGYIAKQHREQETSAELPIFLAQSALKPFIEGNIEVLQFKPLSYITQTGAVAKGIPATIISKICKVWIDADKAGALKSRQRAIAANAAIIRDALADTGIIALVDEATGYQDVRARGELQTVLNAFLRESFAAWSKRIPDEFYKQIYRLRGWTWPGMGKNRYQVVGKYTTDLVYKRLAPGIQEELDRINPKDEKGKRKAKNHQWLTDDLGHPALSHHMHALLALQRASKDWAQFKTLVDAAMPVKQSSAQIELPLDMSSSADEDASP
jgi:hypothetical protein